MALLFEWDAGKARSNQAKHGIAFDEAKSVFADPLALTNPDPLHSGTEDRFVTFGVSYNGRLLVVVHADRGDGIRIISARLATKRERTAYEEGS